MTKRMTVTFHDDALYTCVKEEAAKRQTTASRLVAEALHRWLENCGDPDMQPVVESARAEWKAKGGRAWSAVQKEMEESVGGKGKKARK